MTRWTWAASTARGTSHHLSGTRCQDAQLCRSVDDTFIAIVADGAGSTAFGGEGASLSCHMIMRELRRYFRSSDYLPDDSTVMSYIDLVRDAIGRAAERRSTSRREFACTLVLAVATKTEIMVVHIGDGGVAMRREDGEWALGSWPAHGEYASTTSFITDDPSPSVRIERYSQACSALALFSDGLERLVLKFAERTVHAPFFSNIIRTVDSSPTTGRDHGLSKSLAGYLDSPAVNERTDDDKTLVLAVRR